MINSSPSIYFTRQKNRNQVIQLKDKKRQAGGKFSAAAYKDNMDVVSREDLKSVFEKFGTVKVIELPPSSIL